MQTTLWCFLEYWRVGNLWNVIENFVVTIA
jgi:hypothetical protein